MRLSDAIQIATEIECLQYLLPFNVSEATYYESFFCYGIYDFNPAVQDYIFEDSDLDIAIVSDGPWIYVVSSGTGYDFKAMVIAERLAEKLSDIGLTYERWRSDEQHKR